MYKKILCEKYYFGMLDEIQSYTIYIYGFIYLYLINTYYLQNKNIHIEKYRINDNTIYLMMI